LNAIVPYLEEMRKKKVERWDQFVDVIEQIKKVASEIRPSDFVPFIIPVDQSDLSLRKLDELTKELQSLQKEKVGITCSNLLYCPMSITPNVYYFP
jgi:Ase1/PRC1/MAP65 family protein